MSPGLMVCFDGTNNVGKPVRKRVMVSLTLSEPTPASTTAVSSPASASVVTKKRTSCRPRRARTLAGTLTYFELLEIARSKESEDAGELSSSSHTLLCPATTCRGLQTTLTI